jgi:hypothetical protein
VSLCLLSPWDSGVFAYPLIKTLLSRAAESIDTLRPRATESTDGTEDRPCVSLCFLRQWDSRVFGYPLINTPLARAAESADGTADRRLCESVPPAALGQTCESAPSAALGIPEPSPYPRIKSLPSRAAESADGTDDRRLCESVPPAVRGIPSLSYCADQYASTRAEESAGALKTELVCICAVCGPGIPMSSRTRQKSPTALKTEPLWVCAFCGPGIPASFAYPPMHALLASPAESPTALTTDASVSLRLLRPWDRPVSSAPSAALGLAVASTPSAS